MEGVKHVETLLLTIGFMGIVFLILTPWTKTGIIVSVGSLVAYFYFAGITSWAPLILFVVGLVLFILEILIPGFGLLGLLGIGSVALGIYYTVGDFGIMIRDLSLALIASTTLMFVLIKNGYSLSNLSRLVLNTSSQQTKDVEDAEEQTPLKVGMVGEAVTPLRPSGKVAFDENTHIYDVLSSEGHIDTGTNVIIQEINGTKVVVRRKK